MPDACDTHSTRCVSVRILTGSGSKPGWCADMHVCALRSQIEGMGTRFEIIAHFLRPSTRARVDLSAFNARKYNPVIGEAYLRVVARGKTFKQAMTACMREPLVLMNMRVARGRVWDATFAT